MSISAVSGNMFSASALSQNSTSATVGLDDGSSSPLQSRHGGGGFHHAIGNAMSALDASASAATSASVSLDDSTASSGDVSATLDALTQSMMSTLYAQQAGAQAAGAGGSAQTDALNLLDSTQASATAANIPPAKA